MEPFRIYGKTELGAAALNAARGAIPSSARQLLILIDGQRNVSELQGIFGEDALGRLLPQLEVQGYVKYLRDSPAAPPATMSGPRPATISVVRPPTISVAARKPEAPGATAAAGNPPPSRNLLAKSLLALGVLAVSGALWWFLGQSQIPGISSAPQVAASAPAADQANPAPDTAAPAAPLPPPPIAPDRTAQRREIARPDARNAAPAATAPKAAAGSGGAAAAPPAAPTAPAAGASLAAGTPVNAPPAGSTPAASNPPPAPATASATAAGTAPAGAPAAAPASASASASPATQAAAGSAGASGPAPGASAGSAVAKPGAASGPSSGSALRPRERTMPVLSRYARRAGVESGELVVRLHVSARGTVDAVDVVKANPRQVYDVTIEQTLKKWTFDPPGAPIETNVEFVFKP